MVELRFLEKGIYSSNRLCYLPDIVKYSYPNSNTIIETLFNSDGSKMNGLECEVYFKTTYKLNHLFEIDSAQIEYFVDSIELIKNGILSAKDIKIEMDFINKSTVDSSMIAEASNYVKYYLKSYAKLNRKFPINAKKMNYDWTENNPEEVDVKKCLSLIVK